MLCLLQLEWRYSAALHQRATVERLAHDSLAALQTFIAHSLTPDADGYTPSDFPEAGLSQDELDKFLTRRCSP